MAGGDAADRHADEARILAAMDDRRAAREQRSQPFGWKFLPGRGARGPRPDRPAGGPQTRAAQKVPPLQGMRRAVVIVLLSRHRGPLPWLETRTRPRELYHCRRAVPNGRSFSPKA